MTVTPHSPSHKKWPYILASALVIAFGIASIAITVSAVVGLCCIAAGVLLALN